ncbi:hypothetical protein J5N97_012692 [Dioscorea zingiberensis]|uniref:Stigma-specific Stig1 family protein n=1 Tax=Dioscorea zingiberensis TaxID=325984 RepID=A0A9D5CPF6_9LILI|nr:hypothetical protein J5N97_012692 [Dioscorea zingiberensis]
MKIIFTLLISLLFLTLESSHASHETEAMMKLNSSAWLEQSRHHGRRQGCWYKPWICKDQFPPFRRKLCCKNRCVDIGSDENNCGLCGIRCPFSWQCCNSVCVDIMINPFHCGSCANRCPFGSLCSYGLCGYAEPLPPFPFPPELPEPPPEPPSMNE